MLFHLILCTSVLAIINCQVVEILSNILDGVNTPIFEEFGELENKFNVQNDKVKIQVYYETLCPGCEYFGVQMLFPVYKELNNYLDVETYPYGKAKTNIHDDGTFEIVCQHGAEECYGNMLHACAKNILANTTSSIYYNCCMMYMTMFKSKDNNAAANECGAILHIDAGPIKECAKGKKGLELHKYYGDESHKVKYNNVPHILINGVKWDDETYKVRNFMKSICKEFKEPPAPCAEITY